jgi:hypothetical protein
MQSTFAGIKQEKKSRNYERDNEKETQETTREREGPQNTGREEMVRFDGGETGNFPGDKESMCASGSGGLS